MIVLDTNVVSELMKAIPAPNVKLWVDHQVEDLFITSITEAELRYGAMILPLGERRRQLIDAIESTIGLDFPGKVLSFDSAAAVLYAQIAANRRRVGHPIAEFDAQIASIVLSRGARLATRNIADFVGCGINLINPWESSQAS